MRKSSKKAALLAATMLVGSLFCTPAFAASDTNTATAGTVTNVNFGDFNKVQAIGAEVFDARDYNVATAQNVFATNGSAANPVNYSDVLAIGARVDNSIDGNTATIVDGQSLGNVTAINTGSGFVNMRNQVTAIGAQVLDSDYRNNAAMIGPVSATNHGDLSNVIAIGASIVDSGRDNSAITGSSWGGVTASNHGDGRDFYDKKGKLTDAGVNNVLAFGVGINNSGNDNTATIQCYVSAINYGTYANNISATGALVSDSGNGNDAYAHSVAAEVYPTGNGAIDNYTGNFNNNTLNAVGAQIANSGSGNNAHAYTVTNVVGGFGNSVTAIGAQVLNSGNFNNATSGAVSAKSVGNNNIVNAIGAQIGRTPADKN